MLARAEHRTEDRGQRTRGQRTRTLSRHSRLSRAGPIQARIRSWAHSPNSKKKSRRGVPFPFRWVRWVEWILLHVTLDFKGLHRPSHLFPSPVPLGFASLLCPALYDLFPYQALMTHPSPSPSKPLSSLSQGPARPISPSTQAPRSPSPQTRPQTQQHLQPSKSRPIIGSSVSLRSHISTRVGHCSIASIRPSAASEQARSCDGERWPREQGSQLPPRPALRLLRQPCLSLLKARAQVPPPTSRKSLRASSHACSASTVRSSATGISPAPTA